MKNFKILMYLSFVLLSIVSCTKENIADIEEIEVIDPIIEVVETSHNALVAQVNSNDGFDLACFSIGLPFGLAIDGEVSTIESPEDFEAVIIGSPEGADIDFDYPINISYEDGETAVINDGEELGEAFGVCVPEDGWDANDGDFPAYVVNPENSCYNVSYPLTLIDMDQNTIIVEDETAFIDALANNQNLLFGFPLNLVNQNGEEVTAANDDELFELFFECEQIQPPADDVSYISGSIACHDLVFPLSVVELEPDGNQITVVMDDENQLNNSLLNGNSVGFTYPLNLIFQEDGSQVVVATEEELFSRISDCYNNFLDFDTFEFLSFAAIPDEQCYNINFPISLTNSDDNVLIEVNNLEEALGNLFGAEITLTPVYPLSVTLPNGSILTITNVEELRSLVDDCF